MFRVAAVDAVARIFKGLDSVLDEGEILTPGKERAGKYDEAYRGWSKVDRVNRLKAIEKVIQAKAAPSRRQVEAITRSMRKLFDQRDALIRSIVNER